jgi:hypothetical protein
MNIEQRIKNLEDKSPKARQPINIICHDPDLPEYDSITKMLAQQVEGAKNILLTPVQWEWRQDADSLKWTKRDDIDSRLNS